LDEVVGSIYALNVKNTETIISTGIKAETLVIGFKTRTTLELCTSVSKVTQVYTSIRERTGKS
jgi:hypothetical protein